MIVVQALDGPSNPRRDTLSSNGMAPPSLAQGARTARRRGRLRVVAEPIRLAEIESRAMLVHSHMQLGAGSSPGLGNRTGSMVGERFASSPSDSACSLRPLRKTGIAETSSGLWSAGRRTAGTHPTECKRPSD
jgi:hypothetical protein